MFDILKTSAAAVFALGVSAAAVSAATVGPLDDLDPTDNFTFAKFDSDLGTLTGVEYDFEVTATGFASAGTLSVFFPPFPVGLIEATTGTSPLTLSGSGTITSNLGAWQCSGGGFCGGGEAIVSISAPVGTSNLDGAMSITYIYEIDETPPVPLPAGGALLVAGLGALAVARKKRKS